MKRSLLAGATLSSLAVAVPCAAQSSVTLYGVIDVGINYTSNAQTGRANGALKGASQFNMQDGGSGGISGSRWGLRVKEDLGGGYGAIATLENGFNIQSGTLGQGGAEFGRQAFVGLTTPYGTATAGRQYDSVVDFVQPYSTVAMWGGYPASQPGDIDNQGNSRRVNNSVKFRSKDYGGFSFGGLYSLGGVAGSTGRNQVYSLGLGFSRGPLSIGAAYLNARDPNYSFFGTNPSSGTAATSNNMGSFGSATAAQSNPIFGGYSSAQTYQVIATGASYKFGASTVALNYNNVQFKHLEAGDGPNTLGYAGTGKFDTVEASYTLQATPSLLGGVVYEYVRSNGANDRVAAHYNQVGVGADYLLSKRTDVYAIGVYQRASGTDSYGQSAVAAINGQTPSASNHQFALRLSLRHRF
ncbi:porin [Caballeronia sp. LZ035]|uniref:porin n=1 Tax=Caballeronia sp. LZ035 TaxID=3038568 RepID=UPI00285835BA|nr:porin [Caballeronia sp. LZ035]MDR5763348.1 porin [Caballeronia sp. LZ035]